MSIPLVQNNDKDAINTSIIAIKRNIERINMLLGLSNSEEIDTSKFATKEELQALEPVDEVALNNMHSVTSNAVAKCMDITTDEVATGGKWYNGKPIYRKMLTGIHTGSAVDTWYSFFDLNSINAEDVIKIDGFIFWRTYNWWIPVNSGSGGVANTYIPIWKAGTNLQVLVSRTELLNNSDFWVVIEYTKH